MKVLVSRDPDIVKGRILVAAQAEFMAHGFEAASTNRITRAFGGSKATLFRHFPTKEGLLEAVVHRIAREWQDTVALQDLPAESPEQWLQAFAARALQWILGPGPIFVGRLAIAEGRKFPGLENKFRDTAGLPLQAALTRQLAHWTRTGVLHCPDARQHAEHFLDLAISGPVSRKLYGERPFSGRSLSAHVTSTVRLFLCGCSDCYRRVK